MARSTLEVVFAADPRSLERGTRRASQSLDKFSKEADKSSKRASNSIKGIGAAAVGLIGTAAAANAIRGIARAAGEAEVSQAKLRAQLKASGISYRAHAAEIDKVIKKQSQLAGQDDEELQDAFTNIVRATGDVGKSMRLMSLASDLAAAKHIDVARAGTLVAKVASGNVGALGRLGIAIKSGTSASDALAIAQQRVAGQAEAFGKTGAGAYARLGVATENLKEKIGLAFVPAVTSAANALSKFLEQIENGTGVGGSLARVIGALSAGVKSLTSSFSASSSAGRTVSSAVASIKESLSGLGPSLRAIGAVLGPVAKLFLQAFGGTVVRAVAGMSTILSGFTRSASGMIRVIGGLLRGDFTGAWRGAKNIVKGALDSTLGAIRLFTSPFREALGRLASPVRTVLGGAFTALKATVTGAIRIVIRSIDSALGAMSSIIGVGRHIPGIGGKFKDAARGIDVAREKLRQTSDELDGVHRRRNQNVKVKVSFLSNLTESAGDLISGAVKGLGGKGDGVGIESTVDSMKSAGVAKLKSKAQTSAGGGRLGSSSPAGAGLNAFNGLARKFGLSVGSGLRPGAITSSGNESYHSRGLARDFPGPPGKMLAFARFMAARFGGNLLELIHTPLGFGIKNGKRVPLSYFGSTVNADHYDHVHVAAGGGARSGGRLQLGGSRTGDGPGYDAGELEDLWVRAGGPPASKVIAAAVALAESRGNPHALNRNNNGTLDRGLWQVNSVHGAKSTFGVLANAKAAVAISSKGRNWTPWATFNNKAYRAFLPAARSAARAGAGRASNKKSAAKKNVVARLSSKTTSLEKEAQFFNAASATARLTPGAEDDLEVLRAKERYYTVRLKQAQKARNSGQIAEYAGALADVREEYQSTKNGMSAGGGGFGGGVEESTPPTRSELARARLRPNDVSSALASLTETTSDDLAALKEREGILADELNQAQQVGDADAIIDLAGELRSTRESIKQLDGTIETAQLAEELKGLREEIAKQNAFAASVTAVTGAQVARALADLMSGQIVGNGLQGRAQTAGAGSVVRY